MGERTGPVAANVNPDRSDRVHGDRRRHHVSLQNEEGLSLPTAGPGACRVSARDGDNLLPEAKTRRLTFIRGILTDNWTSQ